MQESSARELRIKQHEFFRTGIPRNVDFRMEQLRVLRDAVHAAENRIFEALRADLGKPAFEAYGGEVGFLLEEIRHALGNLRAWIKPQRVATPMSLFPSRSEILPCPRGVVLILGPWNYPFQILLGPLIGAMAAGNCATLKPSENAPHSSAVIAEMIGKAFRPEYVAVVEGGREVSTELLAEKWDYIFFTGGEAVGKIIAAAAAKHLTPCTLELGGKSPCIVAGDAHLRITARRIAWAKFYNAGQNCVSPDYLLAHRSIKNQLLHLIKDCVGEFFGPDPINSPDYARIINTQHFDRLEKMLDSGRIVAGGVRNREQRYIAPTILDEVKPGDPVMSEEIFGPLLPVLEYDSLDEAIHIVEEHPNPLSISLFTRSKKIEREIVQRVSFGGGCVNDLMVHLANPYLPFGGVGSSGIGAYHGRYSFDTFSHKKSILATPLHPDINIRYQPYRDKLKLLKMLMK